MAFSLSLAWLYHAGLAVYKFPQSVPLTRGLPD
jgi:hypothetical protein